MFTGKLSIETLKDALEAYDWQKTKLIFEAAGGPTVDPDAVAEALRRSGDLVLPYPCTAEMKRDALIKELEQYIAAGRADTKVPLAVTEALSTLQVAEAGYRKLVHALSQTAASKLEPTVHVSAAIQRAENEMAHMFAEFQNQAVQRDEITLHIPFIDEFGNAIDMNSALENCIGFVSMTMQMEAFRHKWFTSDGIIEVPSLPDVTEENIYQVGSTLLLAIMWRRWRMTEESARVLGRNLRFLNENEHPKNAPTQLTRYIVEEGDDSNDWLHRIALERVTDKMSQNFFEIDASVNLNLEQFQRQGGMHALPPHDWISKEEIHSVWGLQQYLAYDILKDQERPGGLRLAEWVRGYSALKLLADAKASDLIRTRSEWQTYFARFGLQTSTSGVLIDRLTFRRSSRDLFDHPFIKLGDGRYRLFALALSSSTIPIVVLSTLSHLSVNLKRKGKGFEEIVRETFEKAGIKPYAFKAKRGNEEYEFDAIVPWGNYLFIIECKNRSLPFGSPVQMHYFDLQTQENIKQIRRLMKGLEEHPDILAKNLPTDAALKIKVPVILNCFPYSAPRQQDGIYQYDYSALTRFFHNSEIKVKTAAHGKPLEEYGTGIRLWAGEKPTPEDLLTQMGESAQLKMVMDSLERDPRGFPLLSDWWVYDVSFIRHEPTNLRAAVTDTLADRS